VSVSVPNEPPMPIIATCSRSEGEAIFRVDSFAFLPVPSYLGRRMCGALRMNSPSFIPTDRLDRGFYIVLEDFSSGAAFRETDEGIDYPTLIADVLRGDARRAGHLGF
jgi:hypothetical protein